MGMRDVLGKLCKRCWKTVLLIAALATWPPCETHAQDWTQNQFTVGRFTVNFLGANQAYSDDPADVTSIAMTDVDQKQALMRAFTFWAERLGQNTTITNGGGGDVVVNLGWVDGAGQGFLAGANSVNVVGDVGGTPGDGLLLAQPQAILTGMATPGTTSAQKLAGADGFVIFNTDFADRYSSLRNSQINPSAALARYSYEATMIHELGHSLGIMGRVAGFPEDPNTPVLFDDPLSLFQSKILVDGVPVTPGQLFPPGGILGPAHNATFAGVSASSVYGDAWIPPASGQLPVENSASLHIGYLDVYFMGGSDLVHPYTRSGLMNAVDTMQERPFFSEVELALMKDLGHTIELRDFFGRSLYQSNHVGAITNTQGFGLWMPGLNAYDTTQGNTSTFGVGLHVVGANNTIIQDADLNTAGYAGAGIRIENQNNRVTLAQGRTITASGEAGVGAILSRDQGTIFTHRGTIITAANAQGIAFDNSSAAEVNITGTINGGNQGAGGAAIYMGPHSQVLGGISFLRESGATLAVTGDIVGDSELSTTLRFGAAAAADGRLARDANGQALLDHGYTFVYAGNIAGTCFDLDFLAGQTTLSGANNTVGRATVREGAAWQVSGNVAANNVSNSGLVYGAGGVATTGRFVNEQNGLILASGQISARGGLQNNGTVAVASPSGIATFGGTFTNTATGRLNLNISPPAGAGVPVAGVNNDQIQIVASAAGGDGKAVFNGGGIHTTISGQPVQIGQVYTILTTQDGLTVSTEPISYDNIPLMGLYPHYDANQMWLEVQRDLFGPYGRTHNQRAFGTYFDTLTENVAVGSDLYNILVMFDQVRGGASNYLSDEALNALDQMNGSVYGSLASQGVQNTTIINQTLAGVLRRNEFLPAGAGFASMPYGAKPRWNVWSVGYDFGGDTLTDHNAYGYNQNLGGTLVGMDYEALEDLRVGAYFAYGDGRTAVKNLAEHSLSKELTYGAYLRRRAGIGYLLAFGGFGYNDYSTDRYLSFVNRTASSRHGANKGTVYAEYGIDFSDQQSTFQPFFGLQYAGIQQNSIREDGAGLLDLAVDKAAADSFRTMVGSRFGFNLFPTARGKVSANAQAMYMYDVLNKPSTPVTAYFADNGSGTDFTVRGNSIGRNWAVLGTGLNWDIGAVRLSAGYDAYLNGYQAIHSGNAAVVFGW